QGGRLRHCNKLRQPLGVKQTSRSSGLRRGSHLSLELVDSTRPEPGHARHLANADPFGKLAPSTCDLARLGPEPAEAPADDARLGREVPIAFDPGLRVLDRSSTIYGATTD